MIASKLPDGLDDRALFDAPILRGLDERGRRAVSRAATHRSFTEGQSIYGEASLADSMFVVLRGSVSLMGRRRGDEDVSAVRVVRPGESFGEDALILGGRRRLPASAASAAEVIEIPVSVLERSLQSSGSDTTLTRELRYAERCVTSDLLRTSAFARELPETDFEMLLDAASHRRLERGERAYACGDAPASFFLVIEGLVQLQKETASAPEIRAYLGHGDFFGDEEILTDEPRALNAVAAGPTELIEVPAPVLRSLSDRNPGQLAGVRRIQTERGQAQRVALEDADPTSTQHVLNDVYRMQMARSLLVIDQDTCVRCGHCAWTCDSLHGVSRLVRRGDKIVTALRTESAQGPAERTASLMLPNSCQHCKNPVCMIDCPTGAIGRDPEGEVFIREALCVGCSNCAKACPWDNIRMAPRPRGASPQEESSTEIAVKCDLCREHEAPACVSACPTQSIFRLEPSRDFAEVEALLGKPASDEAPVAGRAAPTARARIAAGLGVGLCLGLAAAGAVAHRMGALEPGSGLGLFSGWLALALLISLTLYAVPKRFVRLWLKKRTKKEALGQEHRPVARSRIRPLYWAHLGIGMAGITAVLSHAGAAIGPNVTGALALAFYAVAGLGVFGAIAYRVIPTRLARLERKGTLPEDMAQERTRLLDRLHKEASGRSDLVKRVLERVLLPYTRSPLGPLSLLLSGRSRQEEEAHLRARIDALLGGRGAGKLDGLRPLIRTVVELRTVPARAGLQRLLRGWLLPHIVLTGLLLALLGLHLFTQLAPWVLG